MLSRKLNKYNKILIVLVLATINVFYWLGYSSRSDSSTRFIAQIDPAIDPDIIARKDIDIKPQPLPLATIAKLVESSATNLSELIKLPFNDDGQNEIFQKYKPNVKSDVNKVEIPGLKRKLKGLDEIYTIVEYTNIGRQHKFCDFSYLGFPGIEGKGNFDYLDTCRYKNCRFTCDKNYVRENKADALMMHLSDVFAELDNNQNAQKELFDLRKDSQIWILWNDEANPVPENINKYYYNWSMSYKFESEASIGTYGLVTRLPKEKQPSDKEFAQFIQTNFEKRKANTLWFVRNCASKSRNEFTVNLSLHTDVTIYGKCKKTLEAINPNVKPETFNDAQFERHTQEETDVLSSSKFFLAFENQNCSDYITEKFWRTLDTDLIPVVFQPNRKQYEKIAPANSFIHAEDFEYNPEKLGKFLTKVANDLELYSSYFKWKLTDKIVFSAHGVEQGRICELCYRLNTHEKVGYYNSMSKFFNDQCMRG